jgi:putative transcriptional regulator
MNRLGSKVPHPQKSDRTGKLLVASPQLAESTFSRSVVFLVQDDKNGSFGVMLNRPAGDLVVEKWNKILGEPMTDSGRLCIGGPMSGPVLAIHSVVDHAEIHMQPDLYVSTSQENLRTIVTTADSPFRIFFGVSGWQPGQLDAELSQGIWMVGEATPDSVLHADEDIWIQSLRRIGHRFYTDVLGVDSSAIHPLSN